MLMKQNLPQLLVLHLVSLQLTHLLFIYFNRLLMLLTYLVSLYDWLRHIFTILKHLLAGVGCFWLLPL